MTPPPVSLPALTQEAYKRILTAHGAQTAPATASAITSFIKTVDAAADRVVRQAASQALKRGYHRRSQAATAGATTVTVTHVKTALVEDLKARQRQASSKNKNKGNASQQHGGEGALGHTVLPLTYFGGPESPAYRAGGEYSAAPLPDGLARAPLEPSSSSIMRGGDGAHGHTVLPSVYFDPGRSSSAAYTHASGTGHTATHVTSAVVRDALPATFPSPSHLLAGGASTSPRRSRALDAVLRASVERASAARHAELSGAAQALVRDAVRVHISQKLASQAAKTRTPASPTSRRVSKGSSVRH